MGEDVIIYVRDCGGEQMGYLDERSEEIQKLQSIYNSKVPGTIRELVDVPELLRLNTISQSSGAYLSDFSIFRYKYSKLDHSVSVALILDNFVNNNAQVMAGLLHEIASPAFVHSTKLLNRTYLPKEPQELKTYNAIVASDKLFEYFLKKEISINEVCDYSIYPLACNDIPRLCANRLEYLLHGAYFTKLCDFKDIEKMYNDLVVVPNEDNKPEFAFETPKLGELFCKLSIEMGKKYRAYESKITMQIIADLLGFMIKRGEITEEDLYKFGDRAILEIGLSSSDRRISDGWKYVMKLDKVYTRFNKVEGEYCKKIDMESEYVDPLIRVKGGYERVSKVSQNMNREIDAYLNTDTDLYAYVVGMPL